MKNRLDLWSTDLNVNRDHLHVLIMDYLPTKFEAYGAKRSWVIRCTRFGRLTRPLTLNLLTWISIGIIYSTRTIYLPSLKLLRQSVLELSVAQLKVKGYRTTDIPTDICNAICPSFFEGWHKDDVSGGCICEDVDRKITMKTTEIKGVEDGATKSLSTNQNGTTHWMLLLQWQYYMKVY